LLYNNKEIKMSVEYTYADVLQELRPGAEWTLHDNTDYSSLVWVSTNLTPPTQEEADTKLEEIRTRPQE